MFTLNISKEVRSQRARRFNLRHLMCDPDLRTRCEGILVSAIFGRIIMRALCWHGKGDVRVDTVADPEIKHPRDIIIKITACAICGSDLHLLDGYQPTMEAGDILGHENMGVVVEVGSESPKGELGVYLVSDGSNKPDRCKIRPTASPTWNLWISWLGGICFPMQPLFSARSKLYLRM